MMAKEIPLTKGYFATVDDEDYEWLIQWKWHCIDFRYAARRQYPENKIVLMHRQIMNTPAGLQTDHIDENGLNNQKSNLRIATKSENMRNRGKQKNNKSGYKGVCWDKRSGKWEAFIHHNRKKTHLGYFSDILEAAKAYDEAAEEIHGEFANTNKI